MDKIFDILLIEHKNMQSNQLETDASFVRQSDVINFQAEDPEIHQISEDNCTWWRKLKNRILFSVNDIISYSTIGDFVIHSMFVMISIFILVQNGKIIPFEKSIIFYFSTIYNFVISILLIWLSKEVIEWRYQTNVYTFYTSSRLLGHLINMLLIILNLSSQIGYIAEPEDEMAGSKDTESRQSDKNKRLEVEIFMICYVMLMTLHFLYIVVTSYFLMKYLPIVPPITENLDSGKEEVGMAEAIPHTAVGVPVDSQFFDLLENHCNQIKETKQPKFEDFGMEIQKMGDSYLEDWDDDTNTEISTNYRGRNRSHKKLISRRNQIQINVVDERHLKLNRCQSNEFKICIDESEKNLPEIIEEDLEIQDINKKGNPSFSQNNDFDWIEEPEQI